MNLTPGVLTGLLDETLDRWVDAGRPTGDAFLETAEATRGAPGPTRSGPSCCTGSTVEDAGPARRRSCWSRRRKRGPGTEATRATRETLVHSRRAVRGQDGTGNVEHLWTASPRAPRETGHRPSLLLLLVPPDHGGGSPGDLTLSPGERPAAGLSPRRWCNPRAPACGVTVPFATKEADPRPG